MNIGLVLAGGKATRMHQDIPKQFIHVENKPIIIYTLEAYQAHPLIDEIYIVCIEGWEAIAQAYAKQFNITKLKGVITGGVTGQHSIHNGVTEIAKTHSTDDMIIVQDSNRPMVDESIISGALAVAQKYGSAVTCMTFEDTLPFVVEEDCSSQVIDRSKLFGSQTPQIYSLGKLLWAFEESEKRGFDTYAASCVFAMHMLGEPLHVYRASAKNIKITNVEDIEIFKALLTTKKDEWLK